MSEHIERIISSTKVLHFISVCVAILASVALAFCLIFTKSVSMPFVIAVLIYTVLAPMIRFLTKKTKMPNLLILSLTFLAVCGLTALVAIFIYNSIGSFISGADAYREKLIDIANWATFTASKYNFHIDNAFILDALRNLPVFTFVKSLGSVLLSLSISTFLVIIILFFFFAGSRAAEQKTTKESKTMQEIQSRISFYITVKVAVSLITGIVVWIILGAFNVELAFMFGFITFFLNFIPNVGSIVAVLLPVPVIFLQYGLGSRFIIIMSLAITAQFVLGNIIEPKVMGSAVDMHPVTVICALVVWSLIWGIAGAFLAVPLTAAIQVVMARFKTTAPLAELMAGRIPSF
ncbi:putative permease [Elusimicrobium minutum Pei191]|uniref:Putative permease n=1 Tax=Elusimicrobium minutum (strain Pei191) TaxID=445932 RepID=B2KBP9_ELUMP|nr:AI-2E family transporter [Elusimicrobium minutum]ACC97736.1 putative permease [Elusimicrobium minutum Pei191]